MKRRKKHFFGVAVGLLHNVTSALLDGHEESVAATLAPDAVVVFQHAEALPDVEGEMIDALLALDGAYGTIGDEDAVSMEQLLSLIFQMGYEAALKDYPKIQKAQQRYFKKEGIRS